VEKDHESKLAKLIVVGDRVLIKPRKISNKSKSGLLLPPGYQEKEEIQAGYVVKCGPGYPIPFSAEDDNEPWQKPKEGVKYIPLQVKEGDLAIFLQKSAFEIIFNDEKFFVVPQNSILLLERDEALYD
jgi:chaperonin GroES